MSIKVKGMEGGGGMELLDRNGGTPSQYLYSLCQYWGDTCPLIHMSMYMHIIIIMYVNTVITYTILCMLVCMNPCCIYMNDKSVCF